MRASRLRSTDEWGLAVLAVVAALMGTLARRGRVPGSNVWDQILAVVIDPYLLIFVLVPVAVVVALRRGQWQAQEVVRVRFGSGLRWLVAVWSNDLVFSFQAAAVLISVGAVTSIGLPWTMSWSSALVAEIGVPPVRPLMMAAWATAVWVGGLAAVMALTTVSRRLSWRPSILIGPMVWVMLVISFRTSVPFIQVLSVPFRFAGRVVELGPGSAALGSVISIMVLTGAGLGVAAPDVFRHAKPAQLGWLIGVAATVVVAALNRLPDGTWLEDMWRIFYGAEPGRLVPSYLVYCVSFLGAVYIMLMRLETHLASEYALRAIRYGAARCWWLAEARTWLPTIIVWPLTLTIAAGLVSGSSHPPVWDMATWMTLYHLTVNGSLQLLVALLAVGLVRWLSARPEGGLAGLGLVVVLGSLRIPPFGVNSASVVVEDSAMPWEVTGILLGAVAVIVCLSLLLIERRGSP